MKSQLRVLNNFVILRQLHLFKATLKFDANSVWVLEIMCARRRSLCARIFLPRGYSGDAADDHAKRLDALWGLLVRLDKMVGVITAEVQSNDENIKQTVGDNDAKLKKDLCRVWGHRHWP